MRVNYNICYVFSLSFKTLIPIKSVKLVRMHHFRSNLDFLNSGLFIQHDLLFTMIFFSVQLSVDFSDLSVALL